MKGLKYIFISLMLILIIIWAEIAKSPESNDVRLYYFDVGQGDAELIQKGDYQILIDGGPDDKVLAELGKVMPLSDRKIETVILTHPHADHLVGLNQVMSRYQVGEVFIAGVAHTSNQYLEFLSKIKERNIATTVPDVNQELNVFENGKLEFLWPGKKYSGKSSCSNDNSDNDKKYEINSEECVENINNTSLVTRFCYYNRCSIYLGDLQNDGQSQMLAGNTKAEFNSAILKIAHHGSVNGTNEQILNLIQPQYAVIPVGADNKYGHPNASVIKMLETYFDLKRSTDNGVSPTPGKILRTDRDGTISFTLTPLDTILYNK